MNRKRCIQIDWHEENMGSCNACDTSRRCMRPFFRASAKMDGIIHLFIPQCSKIPLIGIGQCSGEKYRGCSICLTWLYVLHRSWEKFLKCIPVGELSSVLFPSFLALQHREFCLSQCSLCFRRLFPVLLTTATSKLRVWS